MSPAMFETLEGRRLLCGTASASTTPAPAINPIATAARVAKPASLTAAQVIGTYTGSAVVTGVGSLPLKLVVSKSSATLTVTGVATEKIPLTAATFKKIRTGKFSLTVPFGTSSITFNAVLAKTGKTAHGTFTSSGSTPLQGTFSVKKD